MAKAVVYCSWAQSPHLTEESKAELLQSIPHYQRDARSKGIPHLGSGMIYQFSQTDIENLLMVKYADEFPIPPHWKLAYAMDTGWNWNGIVFGALNPSTDVLYIYDILRVGKTDPAIIAASIQSKSPGWKMPGVADAADVNRNDGISYMEMYKNMGLDIELPDKALESGISETWVRLSQGRLKIFQHCAEWFSELNLYNRDAKGNIVEQNAAGSMRHDLLDATRYLVMSGIHRAKPKPSYIPPELVFHTASVGGWME